ncbi:unnamed protein product [Acidithrix sp. C25]|nr:unnamed protein product [Acidithrix sp. C25]
MTRLAQGDGANVSLHSRTLEKFDVRSGACITVTQKDRRS